MNIIIAPDSFKGSLSATTAGETIKKAFEQEMPKSTIKVYPMADGGEGTVDALVYSTDGNINHTVVTGPSGERIDTYYGVLGDHETVAIEVANIVGLEMVKQKQPMNITTYGIGELLLHCLGEGYKKFIIGLGGSATNDGGLGMLQALGVHFNNQSGDPLTIYGKSIFDVHSVKFDDIEPAIKDCKITVACDVNNPLFGQNGATYIYGPQKGVKNSELSEIDQAMNNYAMLIEEEVGQSYQQKEGAGAAGGLGFAFLLLEATLRSGAEIVTDAVNLEDKLLRADWVITGEGESDYQSLYGKVPVHIGKLAKRHGIKTLLLSGSLGTHYEELTKYFASCHSIISRPLSLAEAIENAELLLFQASVNLSKLIKHSSETKSYFKKRKEVEKL